MRRAVHRVTGGPVVVVTGAASGMGLDAALFLDQLGYTVVAGVRNPGDGDELAARAARPDAIRPIVFDVTDDEQVTSARSQVEMILGPGQGVAGLFSNAGIARFEGDLSCEGTPLSSLEQIMAVNFFGGVRFIQAFLPFVRRARGTIVVNSALMARTVLPFNSGYAASKRALEGWTDSLRREVAKFGVRVVLIEAAGINTGMTSHQDPQRVAVDNPYPEQRAFLQRASTAMEKHADDARCAPRRVSELVAHALQAKHPNARYVVGGGARPIRALGALPDRIQDRVLRRLVPADAG